MTKQITKAYTLGWLGLAVLAIINGIARGFYQPYVGELLAHQISTVTGVTMVYIATWQMNKKWIIPNQQTAKTIGLMWLVMTIIFEFGFGHYVVGHPWERLFHDYNLFQGRIWVLFLVSITLIPLIVHRRSTD